MQLSLRQLRYVVAAAESGNVTEAAKRLNVSQPSISNAIAEFEAHIGSPLFIRHHARGVTLTPAGERVVHEARVLLKHASEFEQNALDLGKLLRGKIVVACFLTLAVRFMPALLARFAQLHPGITVELHEGDQEELIAMLLSGRAELALGYSLAMHEDLLAIPLADLPPRIIVHSGHPHAKSGKISLRELADEPYILLDLPHSRDYFFGLFHSVGLEPRVVFRSRSMELIRGLVANGHGFTIQNAIPGTNISYDGKRVAVIDIAEDLQPTRIICLRLKSYAVRPAVKAFETLLCDAFASGGLFAPGSITPPRIDAVQRLGA